MAETFDLMWHLFDLGSRTQASAGWWSGAQFPSNSHALSRLSCNCSAWEEKRLKLALGKGKGEGQFEGGLPLCSSKIEGPSKRIKLFSLSLLGEGKIVYWADSSSCGTIGRGFNEIQCLVVSYMFWTSLKCVYYLRFYWPIFFCCRK